MEKVKEIWQLVLDFMQRDLTIQEHQLKMWMLFAAGAGLILIILTLILIITGIRRKKKRKQGIVMEGFHTEMNQDEGGVGLDTVQPEPQILSIGDEPTVNLEEQAPEDGIIMNRDDETTDLQDTVRKTKYLVQVQMHYSGMVAEARPILTEDRPIVIGRAEGPDVTIHTNPSDTSVSHLHGTIYMQNDLPWYRDSSRNGTTVNNSRTLHKGETIQLPLMNKIQLEIGGHKVLLFIIRQ